MTPHLNIEDATALLELNEGKNWECAIEIGAKSLTYILYSLERKKVYALRTFRFDPLKLSRSELDDMLGDSLIRKAKKIHVSLETNRFVLVPSSLFDAKNQKDYFTFLYPLYPEDVLQHQLIGEDKVSVFANRRTTVDFIHGKFKKAVIRHGDSCLLSFYENTGNADHPRVYISLGTSSATITLFTGSQLVYHQAIALEGLSDVLYPVANCIHQFSLDSTKVQFYIGGEFDGSHTRTEELMHILSGHYQRVEYMKRPMHLNYPAGIDDVPVYAYVKLFATALCE
ncbi:MAG: DUF3822 family protein [Chitinophagaceae bacterium]|nr:DUF3822 family protein [Chitinophagaceae bacterium]